MLLSILLIVLGIVFIATLGYMIWHLVSGPDALRPGKRPRRKRRAIRHAPWSPSSYSGYTSGDHGGYHHGGFDSGGHDGGGGHH